MRIFEGGEGCFLLFEDALYDEGVRLVDALEDGELAADVVELVDVREVGFDEHFLTLGECKYCGGQEGNV